MAPIKALLTLSLIHLLRTSEADDAGRDYRLTDVHGDVIHDLLA